MKFISELKNIDGYVYLTYPNSKDVQSMMWTISHMRYVIGEANDMGITCCFTPLAINSNTTPEINEPLIDNCEQVWVLMLEGWEDCEMVFSDTQRAKLKDKPVRYCYVNKGDTTSLMFVED